jgi:hypothetical protein
MDFFQCLGDCFSTSASTKDDFVYLGAYVEGTLRNVEQVADELVEESGASVNWEVSISTVWYSPSISPSLLSMSLSDFLRILPRVPYCIPYAPLVQTWSDGGRDGDI